MTICRVSFFFLAREKGESLASKLGEESEFVQVDIRDRNMLEEVLQG